MSRNRSDALELPVLPLRDVVVFPHMVISLFVGRDKSMRALEQAMESDKQILLVAQKSAETDDPEAGDLYAVGTWPISCSCSSCRTARSRSRSRVRRGSMSTASPSAMVLCMAAAS